MALYQQYVEDYGPFADYDDFCARFRLKAPEDFHFAFEVADALAECTPNATALAWAAPDGEEGRIDFAQMKALSDRAANLLRGLGVGKGDVVLLLLKNHFEYWPLLLAVHKLGAVAAPTPHLLTAQDIAYRLGCVGEIKRVAMVIATAEDGIPERVEQAVALSGTSPELLLIRGDRPGRQRYESLMAEAESSFERPPAISAKEPLLLYFTSGAEGLPKMVLHDQLYPLGHILTAVYWQRVVAGGLHLTVCETGGSKSAWGQIYGQWLAGSGVFVWDAGEPPDAAAMLEAIAKHRVNTLCAPPSVYRALLGQELCAYDLSALSHCTVISEPLHPEIYHQFLEQTDLGLHEAYGLAETTVLAANFAAFGKVQPGSMGRPSPLYDVDIVDGEGASCPAGVSGEIVARGAGDEQVFRTGDVAWRDEWGYYWYVGRADDVVRSSGYRIGPFEVESALLTHPAVLEAAVTGAPDPLRYQIVKATVVLRPSHEPGEAMVRGLQEHVKRVTAPYKCPRVIHFVDALPRTADGKVKRSALR
ncbi:MAG: AMP-binding protein [Clostridia bacterium]|nr:AMP-binding protein [Clostridia bacterium]